MWFHGHLSPRRIYDACGAPHLTLDDDNRPHESQTNHARRRRRTCTCSTSPSTPPTPAPTPSSAPSTSASACVPINQCTNERIIVVLSCVYFFMYMRMRLHNACVPTCRRTHAYAYTQPQPPTNTQHKIIGATCARATASAGAPTRRGGSSRGRTTAASASGTWAGGRRGGWWRTGSFTGCVCGWV